MQNHNKQDSISVNIITSDNKVKTVSKKPVGNSDKNPFAFMIIKDTLLDRK